MNQLIYAADDDLNILAVLKEFLVAAGYEVCTFETGDALFHAFRQKACDLVVLDIMMPGSDGLTICKKLRDISRVPIIILTAKESEMDYVMGLTLGGDDYLMKPFRPSMLVMRIKALLRRVQMEHTSGSESIVFSDVLYSEKEHCIRCNGTDLGLTMNELALLRCLMRNAGNALSRDTLLDEVWGIKTEVETRVTDETVRRIRRKLKQAGSHTVIAAVWGYGYRLEDCHETHKS